MPFKKLLSVTRRVKVPPTRPTHCLDCGKAVPVEHLFCGYCGQENEVSPVSFVALLREGWEEFVKVDAKLLRTFSLLLFRPGFLSGEYVIGRRNRYLSPFKMYVAISALFFLVFGLMIPFDRFDGIEERVHEWEQKVAAEKQAAKKKGAPVAIPSPPAAHSLQLVGQSTGDTGVPPAAPVPPKREENGIHARFGEDESDGIQFWQELFNRPLHIFGYDVTLSALPGTVSEYRDQQSQLKRRERDRASLHYLKERLIRFKANPGDSLRNLLSTGLPLLMLLQLPLFAGMMRLFYFRQKRLYVEHLVFLLHTHSFFFLLFGAVLGIDALARNIGRHFTPLDQIG